MKYIICPHCKAKVGVKERVDTIYYSFLNRTYHFLCWRCHKTLKKEN